MTLDVTSAGAVSFWHKVSSAAGDNLIFSIDGLEQERWSGEADWAYSGYPVSTGIRTFRWEYAKDAFWFRRERCRLAGQYHLSAVWPG